MRNKLWFLTKVSLKRKIDTKIFKNPFTKDCSSISETQINEISDIQSHSLINKIKSSGYDGIIYHLTNSPNDIVAIWCIHKALDKLKEHKCKAYIVDYDTDDNPLNKISYKFSLNFLE